MIRRPTAKAGIVASVGGLLVVVGTTAQAGWLFVLAAGVLGLVTSGVFTWHRLGGATVTRSAPARAQVGELVALDVAVRNDAKRRLPLMRLEDRMPGFEDLVALFESVPAGAVATANLPRRAVQRGVFDTGCVDLVTAAPLGVLRTRRHVHVASRVIVHPPLIDVDDFPLPETPALTADEALAVARAGNGDVFAGVRDYRPGDQRRWIHWRTTARTGRLAVREHEEPAQSPVVLIVEGLVDESADHVASVAASVGMLALRSGRPLHCVGRGRLGDDVENAAAGRLLDWAAALEPGDSRPEDAVAAAFRRWGRRCAFVLFETTPGDVDAAVALARRWGAGAQVVYAGRQEQGA